MTSDIRFCSEHGYFESARCSNCNRTGVHIIDGTARKKLSSFLSGLLRHFADDYNVTISTDGWADFTTVTQVVQENKTSRTNISESQILGIVQMDAKGRYELDDGSIRAVYGHSIDHVSIDDETASIPNRLYHGTAPRFRDSIMANGIQPQSRNKVHLSKEQDDAIQVGNRHSNESYIVLLTINADQLQQDGYTIGTTNDDVYTVDEVPPKYISDTEVIQKSERK